MFASPPPAARLAAAIHKIDVEHGIHSHVTCHPLPGSTHFRCVDNFGQFNPSIGTSCLAAVFWFQGKTVRINWNKATSCVPGA